MAAPTGTVLIASVAFAAGIAGTFAFGALRSSPPPATASAPKTERTWSDPVKAQAAKASSDDASRPRLSFHPDGAGAEAAADRASRADAATPLPPPRPSSLYAAAPAQRETMGEAEEPIRPRPARESIVETPRSEIRISSNAARERFADRKTRESRLSSADAGGVMQWLSAPGGRY